MKRIGRRKKKREKKGETTIVDSVRVYVGKFFWLARGTYYVHTRYKYRHNRGIVSSVLFLFYFFLRRVGKRRARRKNGIPGAAGQGEKRPLGLRSIVRGWNDLWYENIYWGPTEFTCCIYRCTSTDIYIHVYILRVQNTYIRSVHTISRSFILHTRICICHGRVWQRALFRTISTCGA